MNQGISKIYIFFAIKYSDTIDSFMNISLNSVDGTSFVAATETAYNFDRIVRKYYNDPPYSIDAIYLNDKIYLIEFKDSSIEERKDKLKRILKVKLCSSLLLLQNLISEKCSSNIKNIKIHYLVVLNSNKNPKMTRAAALMNISHINNGLLSSYECKVNGVRVYCDKCIICNELNFLNYLT